MRGLSSELDVRMGALKSRLATFGQLLPGHIIDTSPAMERALFLLMASAQLAVEAYEENQKKEGIRDGL